MTPVAAAEDMSNVVIPEEHTVEVLPKAGADRLYVLDMAFSHAISGKVYVVDGRRGRVAGMISAGYMPNLAISPDHEQLYVLGTFFERAARGKRTDAAVFYDARTLSPTGEVVLPDGRFLIADKGHNVDLTTDVMLPSGAFERSFWAWFGDLYQPTNDLVHDDSEAKKEGAHDANSHSHN